MNEHHYIGQLMLPTDIAGLKTRSLQLNLYFFAQMKEFVKYSLPFAPSSALSSSSSSLSSPSDCEESDSETLPSPLSAETLRFRFLPWDTLESSAPASLSQCHCQQEEASLTFFDTFAAFFSSSPLLFFSSSSSSLFCFWSLSVQRMAWEGRVSPHSSTNEHKD